MNPPRPTRAQADPPEPRQLSLTHELDGEMRMQKFMREHGVVIDVFAGDTNRGRRMQLFREAIEREMLETIVADTDNGKPVRYAQLFERVYGEPLNPRPTRRRKPACSP